MQGSSSTRSEMFSMIEEWKTSGLSQLAYCREHSIRYHQFHYWYKVYRDEHHQPHRNKPAFVALQVEGAPAAGPAMELILLDGKRLVFYYQPSVAFLTALL